MKRIEVIIRNNNSQLLTQFKIAQKGRAGIENNKIFHETISEVKGYISDMIKAGERELLIDFLNQIEEEVFYSDLPAGEIIDSYLSKKISTISPSKEVEQVISSINQNEN